MVKVPDYSDVVAAAKVIEGLAVRTPMIESNLLNEMVGARIFLKAECLQRTGSFKFRGACNAVENVDENASVNGILACSSGNHAQGVAEAARLKGLEATIIMPSDAPASKKQRTIRSGAKVVEYDRFGQDREELTREMAQETGAVIIHPYETFHVIAGQGTVGLEICQSMSEQGLALDHVLVCTGGGGLLAGITLATTQHFPDVQIHTVEPEGYDDQFRSHEIGKRVGENSQSGSVCDAILTPMPGEASFKICKGKLAQGLIVSDEEALRAVAFAFNELKLVVEPGGAVTLAALLAGKIDVRGKNVAVTLSGGNMDQEVLTHALELGASFT